MVDSLEDFLACDSRTQASRLMSLAESVAPLLNRYGGPHAVVTEALGRARAFLDGENREAAHVGEFLQHETEELDLAVQYEFIEGNETASHALDIISFAYAAVSRIAYGPDIPMPEPILLAKPDVVVEALSVYESLKANGLLTDI